MTYIQGHFAGLSGGRKGPGRRGEVVAGRPERPGRPIEGTYADLWGALSQPQRDVLQSGSLDEITAAVDAEAEKFPKPPGEAVDSAKGLAWALVRV